MKKINEKQFNSLEFAEGLRKVSIWNQAFRDLNVGEGLVITKEEWKGKTRLKDFVSAQKRRKKHPLFLKMNTLMDGSGWVVKKVK